MTTRVLITTLVLFITTSVLGFSAEGWPSGGALKGTHDYDAFEEAESCKQCHTDIYRQWEQSMMSKAYTHKWDEVEYFELAVAHAENDPNVAMEVHEGCNGCHAPLAFMAGDVPPPRPGESRADESVSCDVCHTMIGVAEGTPYNFSYQVDPGNVKRGQRPASETQRSPRHEMQHIDIMESDRLCGSCHNEESPHGVMVKATQIELQEGPYGKEGFVCQDCHMTFSPGKSAKMGNDHEDIAWHLFHGGHDPGKVNGVIELRIHPDSREVVMGTPVELKLFLYNQKTGHKFPTGSVEDRLLWVDVFGVDAEGDTFRIPVDEKGFEGEHWTIASDELAYTDMSVPLNKPDFEGIKRDGGIPEGSRIFRMPYLNPDGEITIMQWHTASFGPDYRIGPRETKSETYTFEVPFDAAPGEMTVYAKMYYHLLVPSVADYLGVPEEGKPMLVNEHSTTFNVLQ